MTSKIWIFMNVTNVIKNLTLLPKKPQNSSRYSFFQKCACRRSKLPIVHMMKKPWTDVTFSEFCNEFLRLKETLSRSKGSKNTALQPCIIERQPIKQKSLIESTPYTNDDRTRSDCRTVLFVILLLFLFICIILADYWAPSELIW